MHKNYEKFLEKILRVNQLTLFDLTGHEKTLNYQRHISDGIDELDEIWQMDEEQKRMTILQLTIDVWAIWEIHLAYSQYSLPHFGGIHLEERWLRDESGAPPCILMCNFSIIQKGEQAIDFPYDISWKSEDILGPLSIRKFELEDCGECWRFYLSQSLKNISEESKKVCS